MLAARLLRWYDGHRRALPWRARPGAAADPYRVWISEIMLQQTRVAAVIPYYEAFLRRFPTVEALARAPEADVLAAWSGLGYYRRARNLHRAARVVVDEHGGRFPLDWEAVRALPGIGDYTAGAILSIAANQARIAADGNARRIVERLTGRRASPAEAAAHLRAWLPARRPGDFNQAFMDLGATVCTPRAPRCPDCPLRGECRGHELPPAPPRAARRKLELHYGLARRGGAVWLRQRPTDADLMPGLWELPESDAGPEVAVFRHAITVHDITARVHELAQRPAGGGAWFTPAAAAALPLTGLARKILKATAPAGRRPPAGSARRAEAPRPSSGGPSRSAGSGSRRRR